MISGIVQRAKKRNALNMVQMKVTKENMSADGSVCELLLKFIPEETKARASIKNENLIGVGADFNT